jgi:hypothetical protein
VSDGNLVGLIEAKVRSQEVAISKTEPPCTHHLLDLDLLERSKLASSILGKNGTLDFVLLANRTSAEFRRHVAPTHDLSEDLCAADVASDRFDLQERLDFRDARDDAPDLDEFAQVRAADLADCEGLLCAQGCKVEVAAWRGRDCQHEREKGIE